MKNLPLNVLGRDRARTAATGLACVRAAIGAAALILPELVLRPWIGADEAAATGAKLAGRALGGHDLALAAGPFLAMRHDAPVRGWVEGGMLSDLCRHCRHPDRLSEPAATEPVAGPRLERRRGRGRSRRCCGCG